MILGNYKWVFCPLCGEKYTRVPGKPSTHKCKKKNNKNDR